MNFNSDNDILLRQQLAFWYLNKIMYRNSYLKSMSYNAKKEILPIMGLSESLANESLNEIAVYSDYERKQIRSLYDDKINTLIAHYFHTFTINVNDIELKTHLFAPKLNSQRFSAKYKIPDVAVLSEHEIIQLVYNRSSVITRDELMTNFKGNIDDFDTVLKTEMFKCCGKEYGDIFSLQRPLLILKKSFNSDKKLVIDYTYSFIEQLFIDDIIDFKKLIKKQLKIKGRIFSKEIDGTVYYMIPFYFEI